MGFYATDTLEPVSPAITGTRRARSETACGQKPLRGPIHNAISGYRYYNPELGRWDTIIASQFMKKMRRRNM